MDTHKRATIDAALLRAHESKCPRQLAKAYDGAAEQFCASGDIDAAAFFRTHAYIFALEAGDDTAIAMENWLRDHARI